MPPTPSPKARPHVKLAATLVFAGMIIFGIERFGLGELKGQGNGRLDLDPNLLSILVIAPIVLVVAGAVVFMVGGMRRR